MKKLKEAKVIYLELKKLNQQLRDEYISVQESKAKKVQRYREKEKTKQNKLKSVFGK